MKSPIYFFILFSTLLTSCSTKVKEFTINSDVEHLTITLNSDSTFNAKSVEIEDTYDYKGTWSGNINEDSIFTITYPTIITKKGLIRQVIYKVKNNKITQIKP